MRGKVAIREFYLRRRNGDGVEPAPASSLLTDLIGYWKLDEASGTRNDSHTNALHLTDNNTVTSGLGVDGVSVAADFVTANAETLSRADSDDLEIGAASMTLAGWFRPAVVTGYVGYLDRGYVGSAGSAYHFRTNGAQLWCAGRNISDAGANGTYTGGVLLAAEWQFIAFVYDSASGLTRTIINNVERASQVYAVGGIYGGGSSPLTVGGNNAGTNTFGGRMQSLGLWRRLLTSDELTWLYNGGAAARTYADVEAYRL